MPNLAVPGARLAYEVRGSGPVLLLLGAPMSAAHFAGLADALAGEYTVVTTDPRGIAGSVLDDPQQDSTPALRAGDAVALLDALGADTADVFGSSGGAVTGLALVAGHPERVRTLVAHEPPVLALLPDRDAQKAAVEDLVATYHREGLGAAWAQFMANAGFEDAGQGAPAEPPGEPSEQDIADSARFFEHELVPTSFYEPDLDALAGAPSRIVIGIGADSGGLLTARTSRALAQSLGLTPAEFPGDHGGFLGQPAAFAEVLRKALAG